MSSFFSNALATVGAALLNASGNAPKGSIESFVVANLEAGVTEHEQYEAGQPVVVSTFSEQGIEGAVIAVQTNSPAYLALFPAVERTSAEVAAAANAEPAA